MSDPFKFVPIEKTLPVVNASSPYARKKAIRAVTEAVEWVSRRCIPHFPRFSREDLSFGAIDAYENRTGKRVSPDAPVDFLDRIEVNFLRHEASNYDTVMNTLNGRGGAAEGRLVLRYMVLIGIAKIYPHLQDECVCQWKGALDEYYHPCQGSLKLAGVNQ